MSDESDKFIGTVCWFDGRIGYGFISRENERDLFVHWSDIDVEGFKVLKKGQRVAFSIGTNFKKQPKAINVVILNEPEAKKE